MTPGISPTDYELLSAYLDGQLAASVRADLEARLAAEPALRTTLDELTTTARILRAAPSIKVPRNFMLDPVHYRRPAPWWTRFGAIQAIGALGALASIVLIAFAALFAMAGSAGRAPAANSIAILPTTTLASVITRDSRAEESATTMTLPTTMPITSTTTTDDQTTRNQPAVPTNKESTPQSLAIAPTQPPTVGAKAAPPQAAAQMPTVSPVSTTTAVLEAAATSTRQVNAAFAATSPPSAVQPAAPENSADAAGNNVAQATNSGSTAGGEAGATSLGGAIQPATAVAPSDVTAPKPSQQNGQEGAPSSSGAAVPLLQSSPMPSPSPMPTLAPTLVLSATPLPTSTGTPTPALADNVKTDKLDSSATATAQNREGVGTDQKSITPATATNERLNKDETPTAPPGGSQMLLIVGIALLVFFVMLFGLGWLRSRL